LDPRTDSERIFLFRGRDVAIAMNSVKILHAVRSAKNGWKWQTHQTSGTPMLFIRP